MGSRRKTHIQKFMVLSVLIVSLILSSCVENSGVRGKASRSGSGLTSGSGSGTGAGSLPNGTGLGTAEQLQSVKVELSHLIDPFEGTYKKKTTIPKNYKGYLYLAGLNVSALSDKLVKVRFNFGIDRQSVVLDATVARAPGIIPQTDIQVLVVDMTQKPFSKMRLGYDLYDYNEYNSNDADPANHISPTMNPRDGGLYCRGLQLSDDPTFDSSTSATATCTKSTDKCLYAYAKVTDATLYNSTSGLTSLPTKPQIWWNDLNGVRVPSFETSASTMCLPDSRNTTAFKDLFNVTTSLNYDDTFALLPGLKYKGPYRAINTNAWRIKDDAIFNSSKGIFKEDFSTQDKFTGFKSFLFPIGGKMALTQGVNYLGSTIPYGARGPINMSDSSGVSQYADGCNLRVMNYDPASTEGIGSCNVSATIEVFYLKDNSEINILTDRAIKLQLIRASLTNFEGKEVLNSAFKRCDSSSTCGSDECCFNSRCWSKELVTQCVDQTPVIGNQEIGANCSSDYECSSLCCDQSRGACAPHNPNGTVPAFCAKPAGQQCITKEFCKPEYIATCKIVKLPTPKPDGSVACALRCPAVETYGDCRAGYCIPPAIPPIPEFDPNDCSQAVDP